ncbi:MAG: hypothetical protein ACI9SB_000281 [Candidatus Azotimanducaceae bacterium]|jgi:uncharacterized protein (DUF952 family)
MAFALGCRLVQREGARDEANQQQGNTTIQCGSNKKSPAIRSKGVRAHDAMGDIMSRLLHLALLSELQASESSASASGQPQTYVPGGFAAEGFIHCCWPNQLAGVIDRYYQGREDLVLLDLDLNAIGATLVEEDPGSGEKFPHLYGPIPLSAITARRALVLDSQNNVDLAFL